MTALVSGILQCVLFPSSAPLDASGIVFMLIMLSSLAGSRNGSIPITLILVGALYLSQQVYDSYNFTTQELPILALITLYLNAADKPVEDIGRALDSREGLMDLIENAKATVAIRSGYDEGIKYMMAVFLQKTDEVAIADRYWDALKPFLEDCRKELV